MFKKDYQFFVDYYQGKVPLPLTKEQYIKVKAGDFVMNSLVSDQALIHCCGGVELLKKLVLAEDGCSLPQIDWLSYVFRVPKEIIVIQMKQVALKYSSEMGQKGRGYSGGKQKRL